MVAHYVDVLLPDKRRCRRAFLHAASETDDIVRVISVGVALKGVRMLRVKQKNLNKKGKLEIQKPRSTHKRPAKRISSRDTMECNQK